MINLAKKSSNLIFLTLITTFLCGFYIIALYDSPFFASPRLKMVDMLFQMRAARPLAQNSVKDIVVIGVDDDSYQKLNRAWPWGREVFSVFLENIGKLGPKAVGLDFSFKGRSPSNDVDKWFAEMLRKTPCAVLCSYFSPGGKYMTPLDILAGAAAGTGFVDKTIDVDAGARRTRAIVRLRNSRRDAYSFAAELAYRSQGLQPSQAIKLREPYLYLQDTRVHKDREGYFLLSYRYHPSEFKYIPFWRVIANKVEPSDIAGKIVLVGLVSDLFHDIHNTPLGRMPGIFINANEIVSILDRDFIRHPLGSNFATTLLTWAILLIFVFYYTGFWAKIAALAGLQAAIFSASSYLFVYHNQMIEPFSFIFITLLVFVIVVSYDAIRTFLENQTLQRLVILDTLTGLYGYGYMGVRLGHELTESAQNGEEFCFAMLDIDHFKQVNDRFGHEQGNAVLVAVAKFLKDGTRNKDVVARYGGDEMCLIIKTKAEDAVHCLERIQNKVRNFSLATPQGALTITISAGLCSNKHPKVKDKADLVTFADKALYQAKSLGRDKICVYSAEGPSETGAPREKTPSS